MTWEVKASKPGMSATYACSSAAVALEQVRYFAHKDYRALTITAPGGREVTPTELEAMVAQAAPDDVDGAAHAPPGP
jgi:hypothetical protein